MTRLALSGTVVILLGLAAGCFGPPDEVPLQVTDLRYWLEGDIVVVNVTVENVTNRTFRHFEGDELMIIVHLFNWVPAEDGSGVERVPPYEGEWLTLTDSMDEPRVPRYYSQAAREFLGVHTPAFWGPVVVEAHMNLSVEFGLKPQKFWRGDEGYFTIEAEAMLGNATYDRSRWFSGCWNPDVPEYYGKLEGRHDCFYWNKQGDQTRVWGRE